MSVVIVCSVPAGDFLLGEFFGQHSDATVTLERVVPVGSNPVPYLWIRGEDGTISALEAEPSVATVAVLDETEAGTLVKVTWVESVDSLIDCIASAEGTLLEGSAATERWTLHLRFPGREQLEEFDVTCRRRDIDLRIESIRSGENHDDAPTDGLTTEQIATLRVALERGYFEVPRQATLGELATEFGISDTAVSQRMRRALSTVVHHSVGGDEA